MSAVPRRIFLPLVIRTLAQPGRRVKMARAPKHGRQRVSDDWYRSPGWSRDDEAHFEQKLARARGANRPQYLRLKGLALGSARDEQARAAAPVLFRRVI